MNVLTQPDATMTPQEAEAIVQRLMERAETGTAGPKIADVAEALGVSPDEVARLLSEIRTQPLKRPRRKTSRRERRVWMLSGIVALVLAGSAVGWMHSFRMGPFSGMTERTVPFSEQYELLLDGTGIGTAFSGGNPHELAQGIDPILDEQETRHRATHPAASLDEAGNALAAAREGRWRDVPDLRFARLEVDRPDELGHRMRWADTLVPVYSGNDAHIVDFVRTDRARRVEATLESARSDGSTTTKAAKASAAPPVTP